MPRLSTAHPFRQFDTSNLSDEELRRLYHQRYLELREEGLSDALASQRAGEDVGYGTRRTYGETAEDLGRGGIRALQAIPRHIQHGGGAFDAFLRSVGGDIQDRLLPGTRVVERTMERVEPEPELGMLDFGQYPLLPPTASQRAAYDARESAREARQHADQGALALSGWEAAQERYGSPEGEWLPYERAERTPPGETRSIRRFRPVNPRFEELRSRVFPYRNGAMGEEGVTQEEADLMNEVIQEEELGVTQEEADRMNDRLLERRFPVPGSRYGGSR